ncbi:MAG: hypothetical protein CME06_11160 [Gemmatimonadetes bacterium]|nr:hypothetical protein [Gemmatimonadota bacterium]
MLLPIDLWGTYAMSYYANGVDGCPVFFEIDNTTRPWSGRSGLAAVGWRRSMVRPPTPIRRSPASRGDGAECVARPRHEESRSVQAR